MELDLTVPARALAAVAADLVKLLPGRNPNPVLDGVVLTARADRIELAGTDRERDVRLGCRCQAHVEGQVLVPARPLAETLRNLDAPSVRLVVEGTKLAVRTPTARFAIPLLDIGSHPGVRQAPPEVGRLRTGRLRLAAVAASSASRDDALPVFTGVHLRARSDRLTLVGTDRFRMAVARLPWCGDVDELDVLVPAGLLSAVAKQACGDEVSLRADSDRVGFGWDGAEVTSAVLDASFPDEGRHLAEDFDGEARLPAAGFADAVRRLTPFVGHQAGLVVESGDGELRLRATNPQFGDAEETLKATTGGDRIVTAYHPRYLADALRPFGEAEVRLRLRNGARRATVITTPESPELHYVLMPRQL